MLAQQLSVPLPPGPQFVIPGPPTAQLGDSGPASVAALGLGLGPGPQPVTPVTATSNAAVDKTKPFKALKRTSPTESFHRSTRGPRIDSAAHQFG